MAKKTRIEKTKRTVLRRQSMIFVFLVGVGAGLLYVSGLEDRHLISEGIAFIIVGSIGLVLLWTIMDIGDSIKEVIHSDGEQTRVILRELVQTQSRMADSLSGIEQTQKEIKNALGKKL